MVQSTVEVEEQDPRGRNYYNSETDILPFRKDLTEHYLENGRGSRTAKKVSLTLTPLLPEPI